MTGPLTRPNSFVRPRQRFATEPGIVSDVFRVDEQVSHGKAPDHRGHSRNGARGRRVSGSDLAIPTFGYRNHISIDRGSGNARSAKVGPSPGFPISDFRRCIRTGMKLRFVQHTFMAVHDVLRPVIRRRRQRVLAVL